MLTEERDTQKSWGTARRQKEHNCEKGKLELGITGRNRQNLWFYLVPTHTHHTALIPTICLKYLGQLCQHNYCGTILWNKSTNRSELKTSYLLFRWLQMNQFFLWVILKDNVLQHKRGITWPQEKVKMWTLWGGTPQPLGTRDHIPHFNAPPGVFIFSILS